MNLTTTKNQTIIHEAQFTSVSQYTAQLIKKMRNAEILTVKGDIYKESTIRSYKMFLNQFQDFEKTTQTTIDFKEINHAFTQQFSAFLINQDLSKNSVAAVLKKFKAVLSDAWRNNVSYWNGSGLKTPTEITTQVYLTEKEINNLRNVKLPEGQEKVLDQFVIQCYTGLRYDVLCKFLANPFTYIQHHEEYPYLDIVSDKNNEQSVVPIGSIVSEILTKHNGKFTTYSEEYYNRTLKTISEKAELTTNVVARITKGGKMQENFKPKYKMISSHTARRTFATLLSQTDISNNTITAMTGHTNEKQLKTYMRNGKKERIISALGHPIFNKKQ